jgi:phosphohistidine swiveling domain-containing protein
MDGGKRTPFPLPSELSSAPGDEGWQDMYPYYTRFRPDDDNRFWFYNSMHFPEPISAFDSIGPEFPYTAMGAVTTRTFAFPAALGIDYRIHNGRIYITANPVTDPKEIERRAAVFQERAGYYYANWPTLYEQWVKKMTTLIEELDAIKVPALPEFEDIEVVTKGKGVAQNHYVLANFQKCLDAYSVMWHHHFEFLMLGYGAYVVFFQFCKKAFPEIPDQIVARMVAGIDVLMFRPDDELKKLAELAVRLKLDSKFAEDASPKDTLAAVAQMGAAGRQWLDALEEAREPWFNISLGDGFYHSHRSWNDDLTVPFSALPRYISQIKKGQSLERPTQQLKQERARIISEYRELLPNEEEKGAFDQMLELCHLVFPYVEDHKFYCEHWFISRFYNKVREFGMLLVDQGLIEDVEDIFQLQRTEISHALMDVMLAWAAGSEPVGGDHWKPIVKRRREILDALRGWNAPPALGPMPEAIEDPAVQMLWGITNETLETWAKPPSELGENELRGFAASPGRVEGIARVLLAVNEIGQIKEGEILVCPVTSPSWGPVFNKIKAAVSDIGGTMSHAAIVAREYGMPAVVGTGLATKRIKTGQRIRVDGDQGIVTILS